MGVFGAVVGACYLAWRAGWTLNYDALWLALPLLLAEGHSYLTSLGYLFMTWDCRRPPKRLPPRRAAVDFFIPTYNEPLSVLAPTVLGALAVRFPHETYVLDDGQRPWVRRLCKRLGVHYLSRPDNAGAKAGNVNHALRRTRGEFVAVVDADFVPAPDFIDQMIGYFRDPKVGYVQGPQEYYNRDSFQHRGSGRAWHEQALFFRTIQVGKNHWDAAFWCGSPSMLRRNALDAIGGVATETVTEDLHTSIRLNARGWKGVFHPDIVALGVAPNDYHGFIIQRLRWAQGAMQVIRLEWRSRGLSLAQRINYLASTGTYFDSFRKAVFLAIVPAILITDRLPIQSPASVFVPVWAGQFLVMTAVNNVLGRGNNRPVMTEFFDLMKLFTFIRASWTLVTGRRIRFRVTPKGQPGERRLNLLLAPFLFVISIYVIAVAVGLARVSGLLETHNEAATIAAIFWALGILTAVGLVTSYGYSRVSRRQADRIPVHLPGTYQLASGDEKRPIVIEDLTTLGCGFSTSVEPPVGMPVMVRIGSNRMVLRGLISRVREEGGRFLVGVSFALSERAQIEVARIIARILFEPEAKETLVRRPPPGELQTLRPAA